MSDIEAKEQICDGGGDLGIDAIEIDDEQVVFYQFKNPLRQKKLSDQEKLTGSYLGFP